MIHIIAFYLFAAILVAAGLMTISARNPVHSVLWLILAFFNAAGLMVILGAEFIAMLLVIVYVGAVAVLFLFVVMMLDIDFAEMRAGFARHLPIGAVLALVLTAELIFALGSWQASAIQTVNVPTNTTGVSNIQAIGEVLYTRYLLLFEVAGIVLIVALIGAIVLTNRPRGGVRRQNVAWQNARRPADATVLIHQASGEGVKL
jgi:NADH-quinone oxidoreductase subunit J